MQAGILFEKTYLNTKIITITKLHKYHSNKEVEQS